MDKTKHFLLPFLTIIISTLFVTFYPNFKLGTITNLIVVGAVFGSSIFFFYYIFCKLIPDSRNKDFPPQITMLMTMYKNQLVDKDGLKTSRKTWAFKLTALFTTLSIIVGFLLWDRLPKEYLV